MFKFSVFTVMLPDLTPADAASAMQAAGYEGIEWRVTDIPPERLSETPSFWGNNLCTFPLDTAAAKQAGEVAVNAGLDVIGLGTYINVGEIDKVKTAMAFAKICGAKQIRVSPGYWNNQSDFADSFDRAIDFLTEVESLAKETGIRALIEIHHQTLTPSASLAYRVVSRFDPACIGVLHDAGNMVKEGFENYRMGLQILGPYLAHVHIKNGAYKVPEGGGLWQESWSPLEDGIVNWHELITALMEFGYDGWLGLEDFSGVRPSREALQYNITFLKTIIAEINGTA